MRRWAWRIFVATSAGLLLGALGFWLLGSWAGSGVRHVRLDGPPEAMRREERVLSCGSRSLEWASITHAFAPLDARRAAALPRGMAFELGFASGRNIPVHLPEGPDGYYDQASGGTRWGFRRQSGWSSGAWGALGYDPSIIGYFPGRGAPPAAAAPVDVDLVEPFDVRRGSFTRVALPWWFLTLLFALAPARALYTFRKARRRQPHQCPACGYDLRATTDAAGPRLPTCPECGRAAGG